MSNTVDLIAQYEGFSATPYWDHGQWSVGYGSFAGSRDRNNPPNIRVNQAEARTMLQGQLGRYENSVDKYDSTYNWTPAERQALTSFAYNVGSIDQLTDNGARSREEIAAAMPLYNKASQQVMPGLTRRRLAEQAIFTGGNPPPPLDTNVSNSSVTNNDDSNVTGTSDVAESDSGTNFDNAESLSDIVTRMEDNNEWWSNALDEYENYTYHLELLMVNQTDAIEFMQNESDNLDTIISNGWPGPNVNYITIAETGVTTEFNLQDLEIKSLGAGSSSTSKLAGTATSLEFSIVQVGNTSLNDNLMNAALLSGYSSISEAKFFFKVNFKGYTDDGTIMVSEQQNLTKVFPFVIKNIGDVSTGTDAKGTITNIEGTIAQDYATSTSLNQIIYNFEFHIKETLEETLADFFDKLNDNIRRNDFSSEDPNSNVFIHEYEYTFDDEFKTMFAESKMNGENSSHSGSSNNTVSRRLNGINISQQIGTVVPGLNILDVLYDICIQSTDVRNALTEEADTFNDTITILPTAVPKAGGLNVMSGEAGHKVNYFITTQPKIIVQNIADNVNKVTKAAQLIKEVFDTGKCKKVYYHEFTGMNDQILDLNLSFNRQLVKAYNVPKDAAFFNHFLQGTEAISTDLNPRAQARLEELQTQANALDVDRQSGLENIESIRSEIENTSDTIESSLQNRVRNTLSTSGVDAGIANQISSDMSGKSVYEQIEIIKQYDPEFLQSPEYNEIQNNFDELIDRENAALQSQSELGRSQGDIERDRDNVIAQAMSANYSKYVNDNLARTSENFRSASNDAASNQIIIEEIAEDMVTRMSTAQLEDIVEAMLVNPVIFKRTVLADLLRQNNTTVFSSADEEDIALAKAKFYEAKNMDISMATMKLTIKGDPYWIDTYLTPSTAKELFGNNNALDDKRNHPTNINGSNYVTVVVNKAAGVDEFDNTKIAQLSTMLYAVKNVTSSFSSGQFTQQLEMIRIPVPESFIPVNPFIHTIESDTSYGSDQFGEFEGIESEQPSVTEETTEVAPPSYTLPSSFGIVPNPENFPMGAGSFPIVDPNGNVGVLIDPDGAPAAINALTANTQLLLENDGVPTTEQANQYENNKAQVEYYCAQGSEAACIALQTSTNTINNQIVNNIAGEPPYDNQQIVNDLNESGIELTPEGISIIQESMTAAGHETFNADDIEGISQAEVDAFRQRKDDAAAAYYIGTNGIIENPQSVIQSVDTIDITTDPFVSRGSDITVISDQLGPQGYRFVVTEVPINTLTPIEFEKAQAIQNELRTKLRNTELHNMSDAQYAEVKELESAVNDLVSSATTGERGELLNEYQEYKRQEDINVLEAEEDALQEDLESWYWTNNDRKEDEQSIADIREELALLRQESIEAGFTDETEGE